MQRGIIDRFEGRYAIIEMSQGPMKIIVKQSLPAKASVGDVILIHANNQITLDTKRTATRKKEIEDLANDLFEE